MEDYLPGIALLLEVLVLLWLGKIVAALALRRNLNTQVTTVDNPAVSIFICGYYLALFIALSGLLIGPGHEFGADLRDIAIYGGVAILCLLISMIFWPAFFRISIKRELFDQKSVGDAVLAAAVLVATGLIFRGSLWGDEPGRLEHVLAFFGLGQLSLFVMSLVYQLSTPYDAHKEISENKNLAAAFGFAGAVIAFGIILSNAAGGSFTTWTESLRGFGKMAAPVLLVYPIRIVVANGLMLSFKNLDKEITADRNIGAGLIEAVTYVGIALIVVEVLA